MNTVDRTLARRTWPRSAALALAFVLSATVSAADWPQWLGPDRSCVVPAGALPDAWPNGGPKEVWKVPCGEGCSTPVVSGGRVVVMDRLGDTERIVCLSAKDGGELWTVEYPETYKAGKKWGQGARSTPATDGERVYCFGIAAQLTCAELATGKVVWQTRLLGPKPRLRGGYGVYSNVLLEGDLLIVMRPRTPAVVALDKRTGRPVWKALSTGAYFGTPVCRTVAGRRQLVAATWKHTAGLDPRTGAVLWKHPHPKAIDAFLTPTVHRDMIVFRGYGVRTFAFTVIAADGGFRTEDVWTHREMSPWFNALAARDGRLYVPNQGYRYPFLYCCEMATGKVIWKHRIKRLGAKVCSWVVVSGKTLLVQIEDGRVILGRDAGDAFQELGRTTILSKTVYAMPAVVDGRLYARDFHHVVCLELKSAADGKADAPARD